MNIPQQTRHKRSQQMPVADELGSSLLDGMGFGGHVSLSRPMKRRNGDKLFSAFLTPRSILPMDSRRLPRSRARWTLLKPIASRSSCKRLGKQPAKLASNRSR
jgi:hypothetical protein